MPAQTWVEPVVLEGTRVRMEPLSMAHFDDLAAYEHRDDVAEREQ